MKKNLVIAILGMTTACAIGTHLPAQAQDNFPSKAIKIVVPYPPGGATDVSARLLASEMSKQLNQNVIVENKAGVAGVIGTDFVAKSAPDGYTLVFGGPGNLMLRPIMDPNIPYSVENDLAPISHVVTYDHLLVVRNGLPARNVDEFLKLAKNQKLTYGSSGTGGPQHLGMELLKHMAKVDMTHVPYKGESPVLVDLVGERVDAAIITSAVAGQLIKTGKIRAIAATNPYRSKSFPELPTVAEAALPGYELVSFGGLMAPAKTPQPVLDKLTSSTMASMKNPSVQEQFYDAGLFPIGSSSQELKEFLRKERAKWEPIIKSAGVKLQ